MNDTDKELTQNVDEQEIEVVLERIAQVDKLSHFDRRAIRRYDGRRVEVDLTARLVPAPDKQQVSLLLSVVYRTAPRDAALPLLRCTASADFSLKPYGQAVNIADDGQTLRLPHHLLTMLLGIGIGALRGMIALQTVDTPLADNPLPVMNIADLAARLNTAN